MSQELENPCGLTYGNRMSAYACAACTASIHLLNSISAQSCSKGDQDSMQLKKCKSMMFHF